MNSSSFVKLMSRMGIFHRSYNYSPALRACQIRSCNMSTNVSVSQTKEKESFLDVLPTIIDTIKTSPTLAEIPEVASWIKQILEYNLTGGKLNRGVTTVFAYEMLEKPENITSETMKQARILGWCVEMLQAYFLVADDMMDGSLTRRGVPCWYQLPEVGLSAINDAILIYSSIFQVLKTYFGHMPQYTDILDLFNDTIFLTSSGQYLDYSTAHRKKDDYSLFTMERYESIVKYKTAYYSYKLPVGLGMLLANIRDKDTFAKVEDITLGIGKLFQMQDDFIDCYSDESVSGKVGTDIQEGKCSWLAVAALQRCSPSQLSIFTQYYGSSEPESVECIKRLYDELELPSAFRKIEKATSETLRAKANALYSDAGLNPKLFYALLDAIYKRKQ